MCESEDERDRELKKECDILYKTAIRADVKDKLDDLFYMAVNAYIDTGKQWNSGDGKLLGFVREYIKNNI